MALKFENIPSAVHHTCHLTCLAQERSKFSMFYPQETYTFFMDLKFENIPSFVLHTFHLTYLAKDKGTFSIFSPSQYLCF